MNAHIDTEQGTVRVYTRHRPECPQAKDINHNDCDCPKWLYTWVKRTGEKTRKSLATTSFNQAKAKATEVVKSMDPEIAEARAAKAGKTKQLRTVADACQLWIDRSTTLLGAESNSIAGYRTINIRLKAFAGEHGIRHIQEITTEHLQQWLKGPAWDKLKDTTKAQRWGCVRSMFNYFVEIHLIEKSPAAPIRRIKTDREEHRQGPYTDEQIGKILSSVEPSRSFNLPIHLRKSYTPRLKAFIDLLLHTGCDVSDAVLFDPTRMEEVKIGKRRVDVYTYRRLKTGVEAIVPIPSEMATALRSIPLEPGVAKEMPFRTQGLLLKHDQQKWSSRVSAVIDHAGVEKVALPPGKHGQARSKDANVKQFRHTFAVRQLRAGQRLDDVAKMLGHKGSTEMLRNHYAPYVPELRTAHITRVIGSW